MIERHLWIATVDHRMVQWDGSGSTDSARTMLETIEFIKRRDGAMITYIANELGYAKSTVTDTFDFVRDWKCRKKDAEFYVELRFLDLRQHARTRRERYELSKKKIENR